LPPYPPYPPTPFRYPWVVNCRFVRDSFTWNEICDEGDYVIEESLGSDVVKKLLLTIDDAVAEFEAAPAPKAVAPEVEGGSQITKSDPAALEYKARKSKGKAEVVPAAMYRSAESVAPLNALGVETTPGPTDTYLPPAVLPPSYTREFAKYSSMKKRIGYRGDTEVKAVVAGTKRIRGGAPVAEGFENLGDGVHPAPAAEPDSSLGPDAWFSEDPAGVADLEKALLSEWFDKSQPHLTPALYVTTRNKIIELYKENKHKLLTINNVRKSVPGEYS
ncbi:hypothetical protein TeGR_g9775, partial [Tetraparma gracilis]